MRKVHLEIDHEGAHIALHMIQTFGFCSIAVTKKGIVLLPVHKAISLAKKAEPKLKAKIGTPRQRARHEFAEAK